MGWAGRRANASGAEVVLHVVVAASGAAFSLSVANASFPAELFTLDGVAGNSLMLTTTTGAH